MNIQSADEAYASVLSYVGANAKGLDYLDQRYISETKNGTYTYTGSVDKLKGIIDSQNDAGGYPDSSKFKGGTAYTDSDHDGISDEWEKSHGLDPNNAADGNIITLSDEGYTNVELFLNELAGDDIRVSVKAEPIDGTLIKQLEVKDSVNRLNWSLAESVHTGDNVYGDRDAVFTTLPAALDGAEYIRTACDSKTSTGTLAQFTAGENMTVYAAFDSRVENAPAWLSTWEKTDLTAENNKGVTYVIYSLNVSSGDTVTLGANGQSQGCVNYAVFAAKQSEKMRPIISARLPCAIKLRIL